MHINNVHIHLGRSGPMGAALLGTMFAAMQPPVGSSSARTHDAPNQPIKAATALPKIGEAWPGVDGVYAGVSRGENGGPDEHLVLLNAEPERDMNWDDANAWAEKLGDGARLPTRFESALIYANLQDKVNKDRWHWIGEQYSSGYAWYQSFHYGSQLSLAKSYEARCRAVRRFPA